MPVELQGVSCPLITPFRNHGIDTDTLAEHVTTLVEAGVTGLVPCGTTGEFAALTADERETVIRTVTTAAPADVTVVAGTGATSVSDAAARIKDADAAGADAALLPPPYFHSGSVAGVWNFYDAVLERSSLPVVLYNFPALTGTCLAISMVASLATEDRVIGLKDSSGDYDYFARSHSETPTEFAVVVGNDRLLAPAVAAGATGGINGLSNVSPETLVAIHDAVRRGDHKHATHLRESRLEPLLATTREHGYIPTLKAVLAARGTCTPEVRPPLVETTIEDVRAVVDVTDT